MKLSTKPFFGIGMLSGTAIVSRFADQALMRSAAAVLVWMAVTLALWPFASRDFSWALIELVAVGAGGGLATVLQTRLMDVAGDAQALAAALNHSALNVGNALEPWLGGLAIAAGYGCTSTGWVGAGLALAGLLVLCVSTSVDGRSRTVSPTHFQATRTSAPPS